MLIPEEKHARARIVQFIHLVKIGDFVDVHKYVTAKFLIFRDVGENLVLAHARLVPVSTESDDDDAIFLGEDGLVHVPSGVKVR